MSWDRAGLPPDDSEAALAAYETELFPRSAESAGESADSLEIIFRDDSPRGLIELFEGFVADQVMLYSSQL